MASALRLAAAHTAPHLNRCDRPGRGGDRITDHQPAASTSPGGGDSAVDRWAGLVTPRTVDLATRATTNQLTSHPLRVGREYWGRCRLRSVIDAVSAACTAAARGVCVRAPARPAGRTWPSASVSGAVPCPRGPGADPAGAHPRAGPAPGPGDAPGVRLHTDAGLRGRSSSSPPAFRQVLDSQGSTATGRRRAAGSSLRPPGRSGGDVPCGRAGRSAAACGPSHRGLGIHLAGAGSRVAGS